MWPLLAAALAFATTLAEPLAVAVAGFTAAGVLAVTAGVEPEPLVLLERPYRTKNDTPASTSTPASAIWNGRESCAIPPSFGISATEVERRISRWTVDPCPILASRPAVGVPICPV